ncbi:SH3 domain-containing protein [Catalinimonas niigatensis]|uniref:SH3 domain-containing protein n=1 Tax=Catalinimonas niigatensis TaxID=1397264 RepID=UPI0026662829|nr:SH3 domain-containing protein [Catalinimonas niigatensis]WPP48907.1 SH3 domain-containing protein [Catalinimonas niigatensis]
MKIQNQFRKIILLFELLIFSIICGGKIYAQEASATHLKQADSLFAIQQYTESFKFYDEVYSKANMVSPAMLLKMAFIQEGLGEYSEALYYLSEYYLMTSDDAAVEKIATLSKEHNLRGYEFTDFDLIQSFVKKNQYIFIYILLATALAGLTYFIFRGKKHAEKPYGFGISYVLLLGLLFYLTNFSLTPNHAIITESNTYIMTAPSAGAEVIRISDKGHRVKVAGQEDVWTKIEWNGEAAFIRQDNLRLLKQ